MSNQDFVKGKCRHCDGHLEFPAEAVGQSIECPHCGRVTELVTGVAANQPKGGGRLRLAIVAVVLLAAVGVVTVVLTDKKGTGIIVSEVKTNLPPPAPVPVVSSPAATAAVVQVTAPADVLAPGEIQTNGFRISPVRLENTPGSSLVYVTGKVRNLGSQQRFGVRIEFQLFDTNNEPIGKAMDQQSVLEAGSEWQFKAMVMKSKTVSARFDSIHEDQ